MDGRQFGNYELIELLGRGGMGEVWRAKHVRLDRLAAVKLIRPESLRGVDGDEAPLTVLRRFEREAKAMSALKSPHTVEIYDYGTTPEGTFFYAMELLEGLDFKSLVDRFGPVSSDRVVHLLLQSVGSLEEAHDSGLVHRDVKPANLFVCRLGLQVDFVKVLDFGLVKHAAGTGKELSQLTHDGVAPGSPAFLAPEVAKGTHAIDARTDIYSLGCVAYWLLTGGLVFEADSPLAMVLAHIEREPLPPSQRSELPVPEALEAVVLECLAKKPGDRPASMRALHERLEAIPFESPWTQARAKKWWELHRPFEGWKPVGVLADDALKRGRPPDSDPALQTARKEALGVLQEAFAQSEIDESELSRRTELAEYAGTRGEIDAVVADLLEALPPEGAMVRANDPLPARGDRRTTGGALVPVRAETQRMYSILGATVRRGRWRPARLVRSINIMGGTELDFRDADLGPGMTEIKCLAIMGGVQITVPPDVYVEVNGSSFLGAFEQRGGGGKGPSDERPWLRVGGFAMMGGVEVRVRGRRNTTGEE